MPKSFDNEVKLEADLELDSNECEEAGLSSRTHCRLIVMGKCPTCGWDLCDDHLKRHEADCPAS